MIKVLARPTNNAEQFMDKEVQFKCDYFTKFCAGLHEIFGFHRFNLSSFVVCFNVAGLIIFWQDIKISSLCYHLPWSKFARLFQNADDPQRTKNFPKQKDLSRNEQRYVGRNASKVDATDVLICSLRVESLPSKVPTRYWKYWIVKLDFNTL